MNNRVNGLYKKVGLLIFDAKKEKNSDFLVKNLSATGNLKKAATNIYDALHNLEEYGIEIIFEELFVESAFGITMMDRLSKAAAINEQVAYNSEYIPVGINYQNLFQNSRV